MNYPQLGDIWMDDDDHYFLFLSEPSIFQDYILVLVLELNNGRTYMRQFDLDRDTETLYDWWMKVA